MTMTGTGTGTRTETGTGTGGPRLHTQKIRKRLNIVLLRQSHNIMTGFLGYTKVHSVRTKLPHGLLALFPPGSKICPQRFQSQAETCTVDLLEMGSHCEAV